MNLNITAYIVFIILMIFIIVFVVRYFYTNGRVFIISLLRERLFLADSLNHILLTGYYLLNIGYALLRLKQWQKIQTMEQWFSSMAENMGLLILILSLLHYVNMLTIYCLSKVHLLKHKTFQL